MKKFYTFFLIGIILIIAIFIFIKNQTLKVGIIGNFSGDETFTMKDVIDSTTLFLKKNEHSHVKIYFEDSKGFPENALKSYNNLKNKGVKVIIFATDSTSFKNIYPLLKQDKILGIGVSITSDLYTASNDYFIRTNLTNENEQKQIAEFLNSRTSNILVIKGFENSVYINNSFDNFKNFYLGNINLIPLNEISQTIEKIEMYYNKENYAYIMINSLNKTVLIINLLKKLDPDMHIAILPWVADEYLLELIDNRKYIIFPEYSSQKPNFTEDFHEKYNKTPNIYAYTIQKALEVVLTSYKKVGNNVEKIRNYILNNKLGIAEFDGNGEIKGRLIFREIE